MIKLGGSFKFPVFKFRGKAAANTLSLDSLLRGSLGMTRSNKFRRIFVSDRV